MKSRELILAWTVGMLVGLFALHLIYDFVNGMFVERDNQTTALQKQIADKQLKIDRGVKAANKINNWNHRSLPTDQELARSLYQNWLLRLVDKVKLGGADVHELTQRSVRRVGVDPYQRFAFSVKGETDISLRSLVQFLYDFYTANHLQRISRLVINPRPDGKKLIVDMDVEALSLPGAGRRDTLSQDQSVRLALGDVAAYEKAIADRNLFSDYVPPKATVTAAQPSKPAFDPAKFAEVTGITEQNERPELWVLVKSTGKLLKLTEGEEFTVGNLTCTVVHIGTHEAVLSTEGKRVQVKLGDNLRDASPAPSGSL